MAIALAAAFFLSATPVAADIPGNDFRKDLLAGARQELLRLGRSEVLPDELGDWRETIDSVLFMLFRSTELYRGPVRVMVVDDTEIYSRFYPEGTMVLSTGLLDHIDFLVFELTVNSPRRARDHAGEREHQLAPFLAYNAARFALDSDFHSFSRAAAETGPSRAAADLAHTLQDTPEEIHRTDIMAQVLLDLSGYDSSLYADEFLPHLASATPATGTTRSAWFYTPLSPDDRILFLEENTGIYQRLRNNHTTLLRTLLSGNAFQDAVSTIEDIREAIPENYYLSRLEALVLHRWWLSTVPVETQLLTTLFPASSGSNHALSDFLSRAKNRTLSKPEANTFLPPGAGAGDPSIHESALKAYRTVLPVQPDPALSSSFAMLLYQGGTDTEAAIREAETAARMEARSQSFTARANYASILFLSGKDPAEAYRILSRLVEQPDTNRKSTLSGRVLLNEGFPSDTRNMLVNQALMLRYRNDHEHADKIIGQLTQLAKRQNGGTVSFRGIQLGTPSSAVPDRWGPPEAITYNYFSEVWTYPRLGIILTFPQAEEQGEPGIREITMLSGSPVSPGGDIRTGDTRDAFEKVFGKPAYQAGDRDIYISNGMRLSVLYLFDSIRSITAGY